MSEEKVMKHRLAIASGFLGLAVASLIGAHSALAERMIFLAGNVTEKLEVKTSFQPESGLLVLDPTGSTANSLRVEIVSPSGRSPASVGSGQAAGSAPMIKRLFLKGITSYPLVHVNSNNPSTAIGTVQIRILAP
jgi:hypothetical protein